MVASDLDNIFWSSLCGRHARIAQRVGDVARYPAAYAPFCGVAAPDIDTGAALSALLEPEETGLLLGVVPRVPAGWRLQRLEVLAQMVRETPLALTDGPDIVVLGETHRDDVLGLAALVYPHYFRPRTMELGRYFGIYQRGKLAAMIGERLGTDSHIELSAICVHPDHVGRGFAHCLIGFLTNDVLGRGCMPFLHVSYANRHALATYRHLGYRLRRDLQLWALQRG